MRVYKLSGLIIVAWLMGYVGHVAAFAQEKPKAKKERPPKIAVSDPAKLVNDPDFAIQGEYLGDLTTSAGRKEKAGAHVIARGDGKFDIRFYLGGLPGEGWDQKETPSANARRNDAGTVEVFLASTPDQPVGKIGQGVLTVDSASLAGKFSKVERKSPTLGLKPPANALVLYAGPSDASKWDNAKIAELSDGQFLAASGVRSKEKFKSFTLHLEFRTPWMPREVGQARGNSGVYIQDRYEIQILDSFGLKGLNNECGGIYQQAAPRVNMCFPPMTWQTYDIEFSAPEFDDAGSKTRNARLTVKHNGVLIHDNLELKSNTPGGAFNKEIPQAGSLYLQNHGDPVVFNNIWIVSK